MQLKTFPALTFGLAALLITLPALAGETKPAPDPRDSDRWLAQTRDVPELPPTPPLEEPWNLGLSGLPKPTTVEKFGSKDLLGGLPGAVLQGRTIEEAFHDANEKIKEAAELRANNHAAHGHEAIKEANKIFNEIHQRYPDWKPERIQQLIAETGGKRGRLFHDHQKMFKRLDRVEREDSRKPGPTHNTEGERAEKVHEDGWQKLFDEKMNKDLVSEDQAPHPHSDAKNSEAQQLRHRLHETEQALHAARLREAALRMVLRDLLNEKAGPLPPLPQPPRPTVPAPALPPPHH